MFMSQLMDVVEMFRGSWSETRQQRFLLLTMNFRLQFCDVEGKRKPSHCIPKNFAMKLLLLILTEVRRPRSGCRKYGIRKKKTVIKNFVDTNTKK